jgi:hypothetical protein
VSSLPIHEKHGRQIDNLISLGDASGIDKAAPSDNNEALTLRPGWPKAEASNGFLALLPYREPP